MILRPIAALVRRSCWPDASPLTSNRRSRRCTSPQWRTVSGPASPAEQLWWRNFHDNHLNRYVDQALHNSDVLIARERITSIRRGSTRPTAACFPPLTRA
jgi:outer membrane protein TolC